MDINRYSPSYILDKKHLIGLSDYSTEEIFELLYATKALKRKFEAHEETNILRGTTVALLFADTSLRTRSASLAEAALTCLTATRICTRAKT